MQLVEGFLKYGILEMLAKSLKKNFEKITCEKDCFVKKFHVLCL